MSEKAKEAQRAYLRAWRAANKEKTREYNRRYWEKKAAEITAAMEQPPENPHPEAVAITTGAELHDTQSEEAADDQLRELVKSKREQIKGV